MKALTVMFLASLSLSAFSQTCYVDMVDRYNRVIRTFTAYDDPSVCYEAMKECRKSIRLESHLGGVDCIKATVRNPSPRPTPTPSPLPIPRPQPPRPNPRPEQPYPQPIPQPAPMPGQAVRVGDIVFPLSWTSSYGATVVTVRPHYNEVMVRSNSSGSTYNFQLHEVAVAAGCLGEACVGQTVYPLSWTNSSNGARVLAISTQQNRVVIKSNYSGQVYNFAPEELAHPNGCVQHVCVGDTVYPRAWTNSAQGARVIGVSRFHRQAFIKSNYSGQTYVMSIMEL